MLESSGGEEDEEEVVSVVWKKWCQDSYARVAGLLMLTAASSAVTAGLLSNGHLLHKCSTA